MTRRWDDTRAIRVVGLMVAACGPLGACNAIFGISDLTFEGTGGGGTGTGQGGQAASCEPGAAETCYSGSDGTDGVGICRAGERVCAEDGSGFGPCEGEEVPRPDDCSSGLDVDCDGAPGNDACAQILAAQSFAADEDAWVGDLAVRGDGGVVVVGHYEGTMTVDDVELPPSGPAPSPFVLSLDADGGVSFFRALPAQDHALGEGVAVATDGSIFVTGRFLGAIDFETGQVSTGTGYDAYLAKLSAAGQTQWAISFGGEMGIEDAMGHALALAPNGDVVLAGRTEGLESGFNLMVRRYSPDGELIWAHEPPTPGKEVIRAVEVAADGTIFIGGDFDDELELDQVWTAPSGIHFFVAALDPAGTSIWSQAFGGTGTHLVSGLSPREGGGVVATGQSTGTLELGEATVTADAGMEAWIAQLDGTGALSGVTLYSSPANEQGSTVAVTPSGAMWLTGLASAGIDFGAGPVGGPDAPIGFLAKLDDERRVIAAQGFANPALTLQAASTVDGGAWVAGSFVGTLAVGDMTLTAPVDRDVFVARVTP